jgi:hypothetical protein
MPRACAARVHVHHWLLAYALAALVRVMHGRRKGAAVARMMALGRAAALGVFVQGISAHGPDLPLDSGRCACPPRPP